MNGTRTQQPAASAGVRALEQRLEGQVEIMPFGGALYASNARAYDRGAGYDAIDVTDDTLSAVHLDHGPMLGYRKMYGGHAIRMNLDTKRPLCRPLLSAASSSACVWRLGPPQTRARTSAEP